MYVCIYVCMYVVLVWFLLLSGISKAHCIRIAAKEDGSGVDVHYMENFHEAHKWYPRPAPTVVSNIYKNLFAHPTDPRQGFPMNPLEVTFLSER